VEVQELLGLDVGKARTGVARASMYARLSEPLTTLKTKDIYQQLQTIIDAHKTDAIVVGLPRTQGGKDTDQSVWTRSWVDEAKKRINKPFYWQDESLTTKLAEVRQMSDKKNVHSVDALAAAIILQDFLDTPETERVLC
jgi:putative transcription antitermination factor YqgF